MPFVLITPLCQATETSWFLHSLIDYSTIYQGRQNSQPLRSRTDAGVNYDLSNWLANDSYFTASYSVLRGDNATEQVGSLQAFSNVDEIAYSHWMEIYFALPVSSQSTFKVGYMDLTADFLAPSHGADFINASMGFSPTVLQLSTYPLPTLGVYLDQQLSDNFTLKLGHYGAGERRTDFHPSFSIAELAWHYSEQNALRLGRWHATKTPDAVGLAEHTVSDFYVVLDHQFSDQLAAFMQYATVDPLLNEVNRHFSVGLVYQHLWQADDSLGLMRSQVEVVGAAEETIYELYYQLQLNSHVTIKPGWVYIQHPAGDLSLRDVALFNLRFVIDL